MNKKGFTLIELMAVIILLGVVLLIAVPAVSSYIEGSKEGSYVDIARSLANGAKNLATSIRYSMNDSDTTYYIDVNCINTENEIESPYGDFSSAYVVVTYEKGHLQYYWTSVDEKGIGVKDLINVDKLQESNIERNISASEVTTTRGIGKRSKIVKIQGSSCSKGSPTEAITHIDGNTGKEIITTCIKATTLDSRPCLRSDKKGCNRKHATGEDIVYGTIPGDEPKIGDAYDCKVTVNGGFTERFYYLGNDGENAFLIANKNSGNNQTFCFNTRNKNTEGPGEAYLGLPSTDEWNHPGLISPGTRKATTIAGTYYTSGGEIQSFTYTGRAARFLTASEIKQACGITIGDTKTGEMDSCEWLLESIDQFETSSGSVGYWLETPREGNSTGAWGVSGDYSRGSQHGVRGCDRNGVRPVITISKYGL